MIPNGYYIITNHKHKYSTRAHGFYSFPPTWIIWFIYTRQWILQSSMILIREWRTRTRYLRYLSRHSYLKTYENLFFHKPNALFTIGYPRSGRYSRMRFFLKNTNYNFQIINHVRGNHFSYFSRHSPNSQKLTPLNPVLHYI